MARRMKKTMAMLLAFLMAMSLLPMSALASSTPEVDSGLGGGRTLTVKVKENDHKLQGVTVYLYQGENANGQLLASGATNDDGKVKFTHLKPGKYYVQATYNNITKGDDVDIEFHEDDEDKEIKFEGTGSGSGGTGGTSHGTYNHIDIRVNGTYSFTVDSKPYSVHSYVMNENIIVVDPSGETWTVKPQYSNQEQEFRLLNIKISDEWDNSTKLFKISGHVLISVADIAGEVKDEALIKALFGDLETKTFNKGTNGIPAGTYYYVPFEDYNPLSNVCKGGRGTKGYDFEVDLDVALQHLTDFVTVAKHVVDEQGNIIDGQVTDTFTFTLSNSTGMVNMTSEAVKAGGSHKFDKLAPDYYSITESSVSGYVPVKYDGINWNETGYVQWVQSGDKKDGDAATVTFYNMKLEDKGTLVISKTVTGAQAASYQENTYTFDILDSNDAIVMEGVAVKAGGSTEVFLPEGYYTVVETNAAAKEGHELTVKVGGTDISVDEDGDYEFTVRVNAQAQASVAFTNRYEPLPVKVDLTICKDFAELGETGELGGKLGAPEGFTATFNLYEYDQTAEGGKGKLVGTAYYANGAFGEEAADHHTFQGLTKDAKYILVEKIETSGINPNQFDYTVIFPENAAGGIITMDESKIVTVTNALTDVSKASITASKSAPATVMPGRTFTYTVTLTNAGYKEGTVTVTDVVPVGLTYQEGSIKVDGAVSDKGVYNKETGTVTWNDVTVPAKSGETNGTATVSFDVTVPTDAKKDTIYKNTAVYGDGETTKETETTETKVVETLTYTFSDYGSKNVTLAYWEAGDTKLTAYNGPFGTADQPVLVVSQTNLDGVKDYKNTIFFVKANAGYALDMSSFKTAIGTVNTADKGQIFKIDTISGPMTEELQELASEGHYTHYFYYTDKAYPGCANRFFQIQAEATQGDVTVTKTFSGITVDADLTANFQIVFTDNGAGAFSGILTIDGHKVNGVDTIAADSGSGNGSYTWTIPNVPFGTEITFTESGYDVTGYDVTTKAGGETGKTSATLTVSKTAKSVAFLNEYEGEEYTVIFQVVDAEGHVITDTNKIAELNQSNRAMGWVEKDPSASASAAGWADNGMNKPGANVATYTIAGPDYSIEKEIRISETSGTQNVWVNAKTGYTWTNRNFVLAGGALDAFPATYETLGAVLTALAEYNETASTKVYEVTYQATVTRDEGTLKVAKTVKDLEGDAAEMDHTFNFTVYEADGTTKAQVNGHDVTFSITVNGNGSVTSGSTVTLPTGTYVVKEDYPAIDGHKLTNYAAGGVEVKVTKDQAATAIVTNTYAYAPGTGSFTVSFDKAVLGDAYTMVGDDFTFQVLNSEGVLVDGAQAGNRADGSVTISVPFTDELVDKPGMNETVKSNHLYYVQEVAGAVPGMYYDETLYGLNVATTWTWNGESWTYKVSKVTLWDGISIKKGELGPTVTKGVTVSQVDDTAVALTADEGAVFNNEYAMVMLAVRKNYVNIDDLPGDFFIAITQNGQPVTPYMEIGAADGDSTEMIPVETLTTTNASSHDAARNYYEWVIKLPALPAGQSYTFTEGNLGGTPALTARFGTQKAEQSTITYTDLTVNDYSFNVALGEDLLGADAIPQVRMTNGYPNIDTPPQPPVPPVLPPDTPPVTPPVTPPTETPENPPEDIEDEEPPLADLPTDPTEPAKPEEPVEIDDIEDEEPPLAEAPKTGDSLSLWLAGAAASGLGLVWLILTGKKRKDEDA